MKKLLLVTALFSSVACANVHNGFYLGAGVGTTDFDDDGLLTSSSAAITTDSDNSYKIIAGYQFNRIVSLETQYTSYGDTNIKVHAPGQGMHITAGKIEQKTFTVAANLGYTFDNGLRPFATIGLGSIDYKMGDFSDDGGVIRTGVGLEYTPQQLQGLSLRTAYEVDNYELEMQDVYFSKTYNQSVGAWYLAATYKF
ncbi:porin family protein [Vibrio aquaticus]|uniref:Porin family protein n=1 Tax=Vibrio aquaticus TaxID=2496559 RepID=A0A432D312_9VIBR|nr:porin family protein [Vibrio aquaticus]RTZ18246.1 porin family protein [Vibrio aquaticus]